MPIIYPFLLAAFPVLFLFSHNLHLFQVSTIIVPLLLLLFLACAVWSALTFVLKSPQKAGLVTSLLLVLLFSYENLFEVVRDAVARVNPLVSLFVRFDISGSRLHGALLALFVVIFCLGTYYLVRTTRDLNNMTLVANVMASALVLMTLIDIGAYEVREVSHWRSGEVVEAAGVSATGTRTPETLPDIYYLILDAYARSDVLEELFDHDNTEFVEYLSERGFYVASESRSNYCWTFLSLASSLNMAYLDDIASQLGVESQNRTPVVKMIWESDVARFVKGLGYTTVAFETGFWYTEMRNADVYLSPGWQPDFFQRELIEMTPLRFLARQLGVQDQYGAHRKTILFAFDRLPELSELYGPVFVFAHIVAPHPPFVFGSQGEEIAPDSRFTLRDAEQMAATKGFTREEYAVRYRDQLLFVNSKVREAVEAILSDSSRPAIIIIQADHGPRSTPEWEGGEDTGLRERFSILNAYYLPDGEGADLYDSITPVNTFRVIFNDYFGTELELLEDESYFSTWDRPYAFVDVTDATASIKDIGPSD